MIENERTLLRASVLVTLDGAGTIHQPGYLRLEGGKISEVGPGAPNGEIPAASVVDLPGRLVMPGLVNAHTHTPMVLFRGLAEGQSLLTFEGWYEAIRLWEEVLAPEWVDPAVRLSCAEMIRTGTTTFADQYFLMDRIVPVVAGSGLRASLAYGIVEMGDEAARRRELAAAERFLDRVEPLPLIDGWIGPHALFVDNSLEAIAGELALADRFEAGVHIHLSTSGEEDRYCQEHFGVSAVEQMARIGVLDHPVLAAHCLTVPEADFARLAGADFTAVLCASACMRSGAVAAPARAMADAGINLALGTDNVANNNSYDLFSEMGTTGKLMSFREMEPAPFSAEELVALATMGGATALRLQDRIGSLEVGKEADLIALDLEEIGWWPKGGQDLYTAMAYGISGMHATDVMVAGRWLLRDGVHQTVDLASAQAELEEAHRHLRNAREGNG